MENRERKRGIKEKWQEGEMVDVRRRKRRKKRKRNETDKIEEYREKEEEEK